MTAAELKKRLLRVVGVESPGGAQDSIVDAVVHAINQAYQILWQDVPRERRESYTRSIATVTIPAGETSYQFPNEIQSVIAPVRRLPGLEPLLPARHRSEVESYGILRGRTTGEIAGGPPEVYYLEGKHQSQADSLRITLLVAPTPGVDTDLRLQTEIEAPRLAAIDLCTDTAAALKIPNQYAESLLYPIAAYLLATTSRWFKATDMLPALEADYNRALTRVGVVNPAANAATVGVTPRDR